MICVTLQKKLRKFFAISKVKTRQSNRKNSRPYEERELQKNFSDLILIAKLYGKKKFEEKLKQLKNGNFKVSQRFLGEGKLLDTPDIKLFKCVTMKQSFD
jgi:hypothetical protein